MSFMALDGVTLFLRLKDNYNYMQGFFQPFWEGALGPFALGNFRHFKRNWEIFFIHFYSIFLNRDA